MSQPDALPQSSSTYYRNYVMLPKLSQSALLPTEARTPPTTQLSVSESQFSQPLPLPLPSADLSSSRILPLDNFISTHNDPQSIFREKRDNILARSQNTKEIQKHLDSQSQMMEKILEGTKHCGLLEPLSMSFEEIRESLQQTRETIIATNPSTPLMVVSSRLNSLEEKVASQQEQINSIHKNIEDLKQIMQQLRDSTEKATESIITRISTEIPALIGPIVRVHAEQERKRREEEQEKERRKSQRPSAVVSQALGVSKEQNVIRKPPTELSPLQRLRAKELTPPESVRSDRSLALSETEEEFRLKVLSKLSKRRRELLSSGSPPSTSSR